MSAAERGFKRLPADVQDRIVAVVSSLADNPRPAGAVKLTGADMLYRVRVGDYRVIYAVEDIFLVVLVVGVGHQREIYRKPAKAFTRQDLLALIRDKNQDPD